MSIVDRVVTLPCVVAFYVGVAEHIPRRWAYMPVDPATGIDPSHRLKWSNMFVITAAVKAADVAAVETRIILHCRGRIDFLPRIRNKSDGGEGIHASEERIRFIYIVSRPRP